MRYHFFPVLWRPPFPPFDISRLLLLCLYLLCLHPPAPAFSVALQVRALNDERQKAIEVAAKARAEALDMEDHRQAIFLSF